MKIPLSGRSECRKALLAWSTLLAIAGGKDFAVIAQSRAEFRRTLKITAKEPVVLDLAISKGDVMISYSRSGQISIVAIAIPAAEREVPADFFDTSLMIQQDRSHVTIRSSPDSAAAEQSLRIRYAIEVPNWIEVSSTVEDGTQTVIGVMGPVRLTSGRGDITAVGITQAVQARVTKGNITCNRVGHMTIAETASGNISMLDVGAASMATVKKGIGNIEVDGARGAFQGSIDAGYILVKGAPSEDSRFNSISGNIRLELGAEADAVVDAATDSGQILVENADMEKPTGDIRRRQQKINRGGARIVARSQSGNVIIR